MLCNKPPTRLAMLYFTCRATLVICPVVAVIQWRQEIARYTAPGSVKVRAIAAFVSRFNTLTYMI
jgi:hypothetical protein